MFSMQLIPKYGFRCHREIVDAEYLVVDRETDPSIEENLLRKRVSTYKKVTDNTPNYGPLYRVSLVGWDAIE